MPFNPEGLLLFDQDRTRWLKLQESPFTQSICSPRMAVTHFPFNADFSALVTLDHYSRLNSFIPGFEVKRPDHLINVLSYHSPQSSIARRYFISFQVLVYIASTV